MVGEVRTDARNNLPSFTSLIWETLSSVRLLSQDSISLSAQYIREVCSSSARASEISFLWTLGNF